MSKISSKTRNALLGLFGSWRFVALILNASQNIAVCGHYRAKAHSLEKAVPSFNLELRNIVRVLVYRYGSRLRGLH